MDRFILKEVTEGKFLNRPLLFHIEEKMLMEHYKKFNNFVLNTKMNHEKLTG